MYVYIYIYICMLCVKLLQQCPTFCDPIDCSLPGSFVHGILQATTLEWVARPSSRGVFRTKDQICVSYVSPALTSGF